MSISLYSFRWNRWFIWIQKPCTFFCQLSTVAPCEWEETHNYYGCSAVHYRALFFFFFCFPIWTSSALLTFLEFLFVSIQIFDMNSVADFLLLFTVSSERQASVHSTLFSHMEVYHWVFLGCIRPWWDELISIKVCIFAYLWLPLRHVGECYIANRKF